MNIPYALGFSYLYMGHIVAFSICYILLERVNAPVVIWLLSNVITTSGFVLASTQLFENKDLGALIWAVLFLSGSALKTAAFSDRRLFRKSNRLPHALLVCGLLVSMSLLIDVQSPYRLLLILVCGILFCISGILFLLRNRAWKGLRPTNLTIWVLTISAAALSTQLPNAYPFGDMTRFAGRINLLAVIILSFLFEIAFFGMIVSRQVRDQLLQSKRANRLQRQAIQLKEKGQISAELADERYHLLKMLTHEVRQPLNTAQAALQTVLQEIAGGKGKPDIIRSAVDRASITLNSISLSISNSILGATLITKGRAAQFELIDLCAVSQLALLDINPRDRNRVVTRYDQEIVYAEADPIVLRLALRNLLENAIKYSVPGSTVNFEIVLCEDELSTSFRVSNLVKDASMMEGNIIERNKRGVDSRYEGYGLGLYIVKEVANLHKGQLKYDVGEDSIVTFEIIIPS